RMILKVAPTAHTVLILGESGTGKELVAREIHKLSPRSDHPFLAVNCASLTETLLESELFGHEKGAFTDAHQQKKGLFERAHHSTLFLDEIGDTSLAMQAKILRVLQEREFFRVGGTEPIKTDVRIIGATNRNLEQRVKDGQFREDLYYRRDVHPGAAGGAGGRDDVQAAIDVRADLPVLDALLEVAVRGSDNADVGFDGLSPAHAEEFPLLKDPKNLGLHGQAGIANLVQEQRGAMGPLEQALLLLVGVGEGALLVPEEFALEQALRKRRAVDSQKGAFPARTVIVDLTRHQFLARPAFSQDEDGVGGGSHLENHA